MIKLKDSASELKKELLKVSLTVSEDDEFLLAVVSMASTDIVRRETIDFILGDKTINKSDVIVFILQMNQALYGTNDFATHPIKD